MSSDLKAALSDLVISGATEIEARDKKAIVVFVPVPQLKAYHKIQQRLMRELEKKFSGKSVVFVAQRRILPKPSRSKKSKNSALLKQKRPRSRTLTSVHSSILDDVTFPAEIVGKRVHFKLVCLFYLKSIVS